MRRPDALLASGVRDYGPVTSPEDDGVEWERGDEGAAVSSSPRRFTGRDRGVRASLHDPRSQGAFLSFPKFGGR